MLFNKLTHPNNYHQAVVSKNLVAHSMSKQPQPANTNFRKARDEWNRQKREITEGLDIDPNHGGDESLAGLINKYGELPPTPTVHTGGGRPHYYFSTPTDDARETTRNPTKAVFLKRQETTRRLIDVQQHV